MGLGEEVDPIIAQDDHLRIPLAQSRNCVIPDPVVVVGLKCILADEASLLSDRDTGMRAI